jgi:hypothetical protein
VIIDASLVIDAVADPGAETSRFAMLDAFLADRIAGVIPHVPDVIDVEFHHALRVCCWETRSAHHERSRPCPVRRHSQDPLSHPPT